ncbi:MAG: chorismate mutase, partial [Candidatus Omnitrophota bacterium]
MDRIDQQILPLLSKRAALTLGIGALKEKRGESVFDPEREHDIYERVTALNRGPLSEEMVRAVYREVISAARALQQRLRLAYQGPEMTYAYLAARKVFGAQVDYSEVVTIGDVFTEVEQGRADYGIVPIENSIEG